MCFDDRKEQKQRPPLRYITNFKNHNYLWNFLLSVSTIQNLLSADQFLGAFAKLWKATISFVMSVCPSVRPHGTTHPPFDGFSMFTLQEQHYTFITISCSVLFRMTNVSDDSCSENRNTNFTFHHLSFENRFVYELMWKTRCTAGHATDDNVAHAYWRRNA